MTEKEKKLKADELYAEGYAPERIAALFDVAVDVVRGWLGLAVEAAAEVVRPALPEGKQSHASAEMDAARRCLVPRRESNRTIGGRASDGPGYETAPGGGTLPDGTPAPKSLRDPNWQNRNKGRRGI